MRATQDSRPGLRINQKIGLLSLSFRGTLG